MPQFVLLLHDRDWNPEQIAPEQLQEFMGRYRAWFDRMRAVAGAKLKDNEGRVLRRNGSGKVTVTDGPFAEAKEILGGYMIVDVPSYDDAVKLCNDSPHFDIGTIEIRAIEATRKG